MSSSDEISTFVEQKRRCTSLLISQLRRLINIPNYNYGSTRSTCCCGRACYFSRGHRGTGLEIRITLNPPVRLGLSTLSSPLYLSFSPPYPLRNQASILYILKLFNREYNTTTTMLIYLTWKLYVIIRVAVMCARLFDFCMAMRDFGSVVERSDDCEGVGCQGKCG
jgi:hypothetical protein